MPVLHDFGSGLMLDLAAYGLAGEPIALLFWFARLESAAIPVVVLVATTSDRLWAAERWFSRALAVLLVGVVGGGAFVVLRTIAVGLVGAGGSDVLAAVVVALLVPVVAVDDSVGRSGTSLSVFAKPRSPWVRIGSRSRRSTLFVSVSFAWKSKSLKTFRRTVRCSSTTDRTTVSLSRQLKACRRSTAFDTTLLLPRTR